jgi:broad specificity phosphatase PhoE
MPKEVCLYFVRHPPTKFNSNGSDERIRGHLDIPPTPEGIKMAAKTSDEFKRTGVAGEDGIDHIYSSDLDRALIVAKMIKGKTGAPLTEMGALRPWNLGKLQGQLVSKVKGDMDYYMAHPNEAVPGGESWNAFVKRYLSALNKFWKTPGNTAIVTHIRNIMVAKAWIDAGASGTSLDPKELKVDPKFVPPASIVEVGPDEPWHLIYTPPDSKGGNPAAS